MVPVGPSASPRSGPWSVGRWLARSSAIHAPLEPPPRFALGFPLARKPMTSVLSTLGRARSDPSAFLAACIAVLLTV